MKNSKKTVETEHNFMAGCLCLPALPPQKKTKQRHRSLQTIQPPRDVETSKKRWAFPQRSHVLNTTKFRIPTGCRNTQKKSPKNYPPGNDHISHLKGAEKMRKLLFHRWDMDGYPRRVVPKPHNTIHKDHNTKTNNFFYRSFRCLCSLRSGFLSEFLPCLLMFSLWTWID